MSKLLKLKEWVSVAEAARRLSTTFEEDVAEADVLRLALDGRIVLSINLVNGADARRSRIVSKIDAPKAAGIPVPGHEPYEVTLGLSLDRDRVLLTERKVAKLHGVLDLPMIGSTHLDIEHKYQVLTGGPEVAMVGFDSTFVRDSDGVLWELVEHVGRKDGRSSAAIKKPYDDPENYRPAIGLPDDGVLVVRTTALNALQAEVAAAVLPPGRAEVSTRERDTLLKLVIGMAIEGYRYDPVSTRNQAPAEIAGDLAKHGIEVTDDTVRKWLKEAANTVLPKMPRKR